MKQSHIHNPPKPIDLPPCPKCNAECGLLASSHPTSLTTISARLNVRNATIPKR